MTPKEQMDALRLQLESAHDAVDKLANRIHELKKQYPTKCCRCWPGQIDVNGYCRCCAWNHVTGLSEDVSDPEEHHRVPVRDEDDEPPEPH